MRLLLIFWFILIFTFSFSAKASRLVGEADFSVLWMDIYKAKLFHPSGQFEFENLVGTRLELEYKMDIEASEILKRTQKQWHALGFDNKDQQTHWLIQLKELWPDITKGDALAFEVLPQGVGQFQFKPKGETYRTIGELESSGFNRAFLSIWLAEQKGHRSFRLALLGQKE